MNLLELLASTEKGVSTKNVLKATASATLINIKKGAVLKEHQSMTDALLVLLSGSVAYDEEGRWESLGQPLDFVQIPAHTTHKLTGLDDAVLLLIQ